MPEIGAAEILAGAVVVALNAYVLLAGADFGGGAWDLLATGPRRQRQRDLIAHAIGPVWEANHVWLILVIVVLFTGFPVAFAAVSTTLFVPLTLLLFGIVLRGAAFTFRAYDHGGDRTQARWGLVFSAASVLAPLVLGASVGALSPLLTTPLTVKGLIVPVIDGLGSIPGAIIAGLLVGAFENLFQQFRGVTERDLYVMLLLFAFLVFRPGGLFAPRGGRD